MMLLTYLIYCAVTAINLIAFVALFSVKERAIYIQKIREGGGLDLYSDWQIVSLVILISVCPYLNVIFIWDTLSINKQIVQQLPGLFRKTKQ